MTVSFLSLSPAGRRLPVCPVDADADTDRPRSAGSRERLSLNHIPNSGPTPLRVEAPSACVLLFALRSSAVGRRPLIPRRSAGEALLSQLIINLTFAFRY